MSDRLLTDEEVNKITEYFRIHNYVEEKDFESIIADLRRYRAWCRRLVVAAEFKEGNCFLGPLADEVRAALEGK